MVDGKFGFHYTYHNSLLFFNSMADSTVHEKSRSIQFKKYSNNIQYHNDNSKCIHYNRSNENITSSLIRI